MHPLIPPARLALPLALLLAAGCAAGDSLTPSALETTFEALSRSVGMVRVAFPDQDPGAPLYARVEPSLNQFFHDGEWLAIPFVRQPEAIPADFNLLTYFDPPGPNGPGAFAAPLVLSGEYLIEAGAPVGTFPRIANSRGTAVPIWFVRWTDFQAAMADGVVTIGELRALNPQYGIATRYTELLKPRFEEHQVVINAAGQLADGRSFTLHVTHEGDRTRSIRIQFGR